MKRTLAIASIVLMAGSLAACGGDDGGAGATDSAASEGAPTESEPTEGESTEGGDSEYCSLLSEVKDEFETGDLASLTQKRLDQMDDRVGAIAASAPDDVKKDWNSLASAVGELNTILKDAGIDLDDLQKMGQTSELPKGVDMAQLQELAEKLTAFAEDAELDTATAAIQKSAEQDCGIDLDDSPASAEPS